jgi:hypothetical protein
MRIDEIVTLSDVLKASQYIKLLRHLKAHANTDINVTRIKNRVIHSWKKGLKHRKHYDQLLSEIDLSLNDIIQ